MLHTKIKKIKLYVVTHKVLSGIILIAILLVGYWGYKKYTSTAGNIRYMTAAVPKGTIIASISGSGQVSAFNQVDIKAKTSGDVIYLAKTDGQQIGMGGLIAELDDKDAQKTVRDAETNLESAQIALEKLKIEKSQENMDADLVKSYDDGFNTVSNVFLDLPGIMSGFRDTFFKTSSAIGQWYVDWYQGQAKNDDQIQAAVLKQNFVDSFNKAKAAYDQSFDYYKTVSRSSDGTVIDTLIAQTYDTTKLIADAIKNANNYIDFVNNSIQKNNFDSPVIITTHRNILNDYTAKTNAALVSLLSAKTNIKTYKDSFLSADLDVQSAQLSVKQKQNALQDAKDKLADYFIRAPFTGTITKINIKKSDSISSGTVVTTLITKQQLAEISLNEVDVAKIKIGQKATLTFDAVPDLTISGVVADIDSIGTVSQGVVTYIVKISFDTQDSKVKPGMSVSAVIITDMKQNVLIVPNSAVKSQNGNNYVESFSGLLPAPADGLIDSISKITPNKIPVEIGLSSDSESEIISGLNEGDEIVTRTILPTTTKTSAAPSLFGSTGSNRSTGNSGAVRVPGR